MTRIVAIVAAIVVLSAAPSARAQDTGDEAELSPGSIWVVTVESGPRSDSAGASVSRGSRANWNAVEIAKLVNNFQTFMGEMKQLELSEADPMGYGIDQIEFSLTVGADGRIGFLGTGASASIGAGIKVVLRRQ